MLNQLTISELAAMQSCLDQIARVDGKIHAFISHDPADALAQRLAPTEEFCLCSTSFDQFSNRYYA
jgi:hypothetical protein